MKGKVGWGQEQCKWSDEILVRWVVDALSSTPFS